LVKTGNKMAVQKEDLTTNRPATSRVDKELAKNAKPIPLIICHLQMQLWVCEHILPILQIVNRKMRKTIIKFLNLALTKTLRSKL
jgi:hypothetical protein